MLGVVLTAFGLGVVVGTLGAWGAGRRFERARAATRLAAPYVGAASLATRGAVGGLVGFVLLLVAGVVFVWAGR